jgi:hypothetical protein
MVRFPKKVPGIILVPVVVVGMMALALYLLGMVPAYLQSPAGGVKEYDSIEEAAWELGFEIVVPAYFPGYLSWPSAKIQGQLEPVPMTQILFLSSDQRTEALLIYQIVSDSQDLPVALPWIEIIWQEMPITISGNEAKLVVGARADGHLVNGVHWRDDGLHFVVVTTQPVQELLALARSMYP